MNQADVKRQVQPPEYADYVARLRKEDAPLADEVGGFQSVSGVLDWMKRRGLCNAAVDIVGMDEFEYDFVIQLAPGGRWVAFGLT